MKYDIAALKRKMLVKYPFFGSVVVDVSYKENKDIPTAGTDGETIYFNPEYLESMSVEEQTFILAHEVCHIAFNHILRSEGKDIELWNTATDGVINQFLKRDGLKIVEGGVDIEEAINYDAEELYEKLLQEKQQKGQSDSEKQQDNQQQKQHQSGFGAGKDLQKEKMKQRQHQKGQGNGQNLPDNQQQNQNQNGDGSNEYSQEEMQQDVGHDTHSMWKQAVKKHKEEQEKSDKKEKNELKKKQDELERIGENEAFRKNREEKKRQLEELKEAISKQASLAGTRTKGDVRIVNDIGTSKPIVDWRYILRKTINYDVDWSYKNATIENGVVVPNLEEQPMSETEIVLDTSGSINEVLLKNFLKECKNILQHTKLKVGCFDTKFYGFHEIRTEKDIDNMKLEGAGGTSFDAAVGAFSKRVENKIIFTDGEALMPDMPLDAIWIVYGDRKINPKGGKVINITSEQLDKLYSYGIESERKGRSR